MNVQAKSLFLELGNVGTGSAMTSLSNMLGTELIYTPPKLLEVRYEDLSRWFVESEENVAGVLVPFEGEISGFLIQIYRVSTAKKILGILLGPEHEEERALDREGSFLLYGKPDPGAGICSFCGYGRIDLDGTVRHGVWDLWRRAGTWSMFLPFWRRLGQSHFAYSGK